MGSCLGTPAVASSGVVEHTTAPACTKATSTAGGPAGGSPSRPPPAQVARLLQAHVPTKAPNGGPASLPPRRSSSHKAISGSSFKRGSSSGMWSTREASHEAIVLAVPCSPGEPSMSSLVSSGPLFPTAASRRRHSSGVAAEPPASAPGGFSGYGSFAPDSAPLAAVRTISTSEMEPNPTSSAPARQPRTAASQSSRALLPRAASLPRAEAQHAHAAHVRARSTHGLLPPASAGTGRAPQARPASTPSVKAPPAPAKAASRRSARAAAGATEINPVVADLLARGMVNMAAQVMAKQRSAKQQRA